MLPYRFIYTYGSGDLCVLGRLKRKLAEAADMPEGSFGACPYIEIEGNSAVRVCGCHEIITYESDKTVIALTGMNVSVCGRELLIETFCGGTVRLRGEIVSVSFSGGGDGSVC